MMNPSLPGVNSKLTFPKLKPSSIQNSARKHQIKPPDTKSKRPQLWLQNSNNWLKANPKQTKTQLNQKWKMKSVMNEDQSWEYPSSVMSST